MPKLPKLPRDFSQAAKLVVDIASGQVEDREPTPEEQGKDPAAVARGKMGGAKGGKARAAALTPSDRSRELLFAAGAHKAPHFVGVETALDEPARRQL
jgi:hypothetical protein